MTFVFCLTPKKIMNIVRHKFLKTIGIRILALIISIRNAVQEISLIYLTDGSKRYYCSIIDLYDRSTIASITGRNITAALTRKTLQKAIESQPEIN